MLEQVCAIACRRPVQVYLFHDAGLNESLEAVVNGCQGDRCHMSFGSKEHLCRGRVISLLEQNAQDLLALFCQSDPFRCQPLGYLRGKPHKTDHRTPKNDIKNYSNPERLARAA